jgi:hypothetical protein
VSNTRSIKEPLGGLTTPTLAVLTKEFTDLVASNRRGFQSLQAQGVQIDPFQLVHARIDQVIDSIAQMAGEEGPRWAMLTKLRFEQDVQKNIREAQAAARKANLAAGGQLSKEQIDSMAKSSGLIVPE